MFKERRIPGARFFDIDGIKDRQSPYPHMLPSPELFATAMGELGIKRDDRVVVYDTAEHGLFSAPRVGWTLRAFGHERVHVLDSFRIWVEEKHPTESGEPQPVEKTEYPISQLDKSKVADFDDLMDFVTSLPQAAKDVQVLDARSGIRFSGLGPEPRQGEINLLESARGPFSPPPIHKTV